MRSIVFTDSGTELREGYRADVADLQWVMVSRSEVNSFDWAGFDIYAQHRQDLMNATHAPFYDSADEYEMLILRTNDETASSLGAATRSIAFLLHGSTIITFSDDDDDTLASLATRFEKKKRRASSGPLSLLHAMINEISDRFLKLREPFTTNVTEWQDRLLNPDDPFDDWSVIMKAKSTLGRLNMNMQLQQDVLSNWQTGTRYAFDETANIRFNDLQEHMSRVERFSEYMRTDLDSLTQIYFASTGQQTNANVQFLAVVSAIFLPLNLVAGMFGMNFENMPLLKEPMAPMVLVVSMVVTSLGLLWWFKKNNWY